MILGFQKQMQVIVELSLFPWLIVEAVVVEWAAFDQMRTLGMLLMYQTLELKFITNIRLTIKVNNLY